MIRLYSMLFIVLIILVSESAVPADTNRIVAKKTSVTGEPLIPKGMRVSRWGPRSDEEVDGWVPFEFQTSNVGRPSSAEFILEVEPIGQLVSTDTFYCLDAKGTRVMLLDDFDSMTLKQRGPAKKSINCRSYPGIFQAIRSGKLLCCLQDDTALHAATLVFDEATTSNWKMPAVTGYNSPAEVIQEALKIEHDDETEQNRRRAIFISKSIHARVDNQLKSEKCEETAKYDSTPKDDPYNAWWIGGGFCRHHARLVVDMCTAAKVKGVRSVSSSAVVTHRFLFKQAEKVAGHEFPVVNMAPDADLDRPWTWGPNALIVDSWSGKILTPAQASPFKVLILSLFPFGYNPCS